MTVSRTRVPVLRELAAQAVSHLGVLARYKKEAADATVLTKPGVPLLN